MWLSSLSSSLIIVVVFGAAAAEGRRRHKSSEHGAHVAQWVRQHAVEETVSLATPHHGKSAVAGVEAAIEALCVEYAPHVDLRGATRLIESSPSLVAKMKRAVVETKRFEVAAAGHSVCAGHGNYFNESYAMVLDRAMRTGFAAAGVRSVARNFGMGGTAALPLAWCARDVFGTPEPDVVAWDFAMVEGKNWRVSEVYARAAWSLESQPLALFLAKDDARRDMLRRYGAMPAAVAPTPDDLVAVLGFGRRRKHNDLPPALVDIAFSPKNEVEKRRKFRTPDGAPGRVPWHPGWRANQLFGTLLAVWLLSALRDALADLDAGRVEMDERRPLPPPDRPDCGDASLSCVDPLHECATTYEPNRGRDLRSIVAGDKPAPWPVVLAKGDTSARSAALGLGYADHKWTFEGTLDRGVLALTLPGARRGVVMLCEATTGWRRPTTMGSLDEDVRALVHVPGFTPRQLRFARTRHVKNCFHSRFPTGVGLAEDAAPTLALNVTAPDKFVYLSHVIWR